MFQRLDQLRPALPSNDTDSEGLTSANMSKNRRRNVVPCECAVFDCLSKLCFGNIFKSRLVNSVEHSLQIAYKLSVVWVQHSHQC